MRCRKTWKSVNKQTRQLQQWLSAYLSHFYTLSTLPSAALHYLLSTWLPAHPPACLPAHRSLMSFYKLSGGVWASTYQLAAWWCNYKAGDKVKRKNEKKGSNSADGHQSYETRLLLSAKIVFWCTTDYPYSHTFIRDHNGGLELEREIVIDSSLAVHPSSRTSLSFLALVRTTMILTHPP